MKNITVSLDDETYRNARMKAAALDTSVSALVRRFLEDLGSGETEFARLKREEQALRGQVPAGFSAKHSLPRDKLYDRDL
jgi:plasmid stability protein